MGCTFKNLTEDQVRAKAEHEHFYGDLSIGSTAEQVSEALLKLRRDIKTVAVSADQIDPTHAKKMHLSAGEAVERYINEAREWLLSRRITDVNAIAWKKSMQGRASEVSKAPDSRIAAEWGTRVHNSAQNIMETLIENSKSAFLHKNSEDTYGYEKRSPLEAQKEWGLSKKQYERLEQGIKEILADITSLQKKIDPAGKAKIFTEQFLGDFLNDTGGMSDVLIVFSDGSIGLLDYKTKAPKTVGSFAKAEKAGKDGFKISTRDWLPDYSKKDFERQIGVTKEIVRTRLQRDNIRISRIVPIHLQFELKQKEDRQKGEEYIDNLIHLSIGSQDPFLKQIPILERASNAELDLVARKLEAVIHNYEIDFIQAKGDQEKRNRIYNILQNKKESLNSLLLDQDINTLYKDFRFIVDQYRNDVGELNDIDNPTLKNNEPNPAYLDWKDLSSKIDELKAYKAILDSSEQFATELTMDGQPLGNYMQEINELGLKTDGLIHSLERKRMERTIEEADKPALMNMRGFSNLDKLFLRDKEFDQKVFRMLNEKTSQAEASRKLAMQKVEMEIKELKISLQDWAKRNGVSLWDAYEMVLGEKNIAAKHNAKLYEEIQTLLKTQDIEGLKKIYTLKENAEEKKKKMWNDLLRSNPSPKEKAIWQKRFDLDNVLLNPKLNRLFYEFSDFAETAPEYLSDKYRELIKPGNEELLTFWNYWTEKMLLARDLLDLQSHEDLPYNFLPWIRGEINEMIASGDLGIEHLKGTAKFFATVTADTEGYGKIEDVDKGTITVKNKVDIMTGIEKLQIPMYYMNPLKNSKGQIDAGLKSRDLPHSLYTFLSMAYNYHYYSTIVEPHVEALRDAIAMYGQQHTDGKGNLVKDAAGRVIKHVGAATDILEIYDRTVAHHVYDKKLQGSDPRLAKPILAAKTFHSAYQLGLGWLVWAGNFAQVYYNTFQEGYSNYFFSVGDLKDASMTAMGMKGKEALERYKALLYFFEPNSDITRLKARGLKSSQLQKIFTHDALYWGFRVAEHGVENLTLYAMLNNYGVVDGNIVRLAQAPKGTKSILETSRIENGELVIDGIKELGKDVNIKAYADIRGRATGVAANTKGGNSSENQYGAQMTLAGKMIMHYKGWLPGMVTQRFSNLRYNDLTKSLHQGTYKAFLQDSTDMEQGLVNMLGNQLLPNLAKLGMAAVTFPLELLFKAGYKYKTSESRARKLFENFLRQHKNDAEIQAITFEDYLEYQRSRIKALSAEVFTILTLYLAIAALRNDWDEDGVPDWTASWGSRTLFRLLNRARREISFMVSFEDWSYTIARSPVPSIGVILDAHRALKNSLRTTGDFVFDREGAEAKGRGYMTYTPRMIPAYKFVRSIDILDKEFQRFEY